MNISHKKYIWFYIALGILASFTKIIPAIHMIIHHTATLGNYTIFVNSFYHFIHHKNLYANYELTEHIDFFKYSPAFAIFMGIFALLPQYMGAIIWTVASSLLLCIALLKLLTITNKKSYMWFMVFMAISSLSSLQNFQTNVLILSLMILFVVFLHEKKTVMSSLCFVAVIFVKLYILPLAVLLLFFKPQIKRFISYSILFAIALVVLPFLVSTSTSYVIDLYKSWIQLVLSDTHASYGLSVMSAINRICGPISIPIKQLIAITGIIISMLTVLIATIKNNDHSRSTILSFALLLIAIIIFNPKAESQTFVIGFCGVVIWFFLGMKQYNKWSIILFIVVFIFGVMSNSDIYPNFIKTQIFVPYASDAICCFLIWCTLIYQIIFTNTSNGIHKK